MRLLSAIFCVLISAVFSFAENVDLFFHKDGAKGLCVNKSSYYGYDRRDANDASACTNVSTNDIRIRVVDPPKNPSMKYGFDVERPFLILDGIYLSDDGKRTLSGFHEEAMQFGLTELLTDLGYTPILVQFSETVTRSLETNAEYFTELLRFINRNKFFGFPNKLQDGIIVLGISQGGILGRYGSYAYDVSRTSADSPIRLYASLDSPHQGAVMPLGLFTTINFWATVGGSAAAESFVDLIDGPGASGLLVHNAKSVGSFIRKALHLDKRYEENFSTDRFLFGEYRKAAEYKGFPAVLISQGQFNGKAASHPETYYELDRTAKVAGLLFGHVQSTMASRSNLDYPVADNRLYQKMGGGGQKTVNSVSRRDFIQGSTYPFAQTIYESLREGFLDAMPDGMKNEVSLPFGLSTSINVSTSWQKDALYQKSSTFIPTASAMDMQCSGQLSMLNDCAYTQTSAGFPFEQPGSKSTAVATYAVDPTHPRYNEPISGRHIELPVSNGKIDTAVVRGMQVDMWRLMCEVAKHDYDAAGGSFRNITLNGIFTPGASCMDLSKMPDLIKKMGYTNTKKFAFSRYDYNDKSTEKDNVVSFDVPAGWHKVGLYDFGKTILPNSMFEVDVAISNPKGNWMKAELLLTKSKAGASQLQFSELNVPLDGKFHTLRWQMPATDEAVERYRWFRLVLNSDGASVKVSNPRIVTNVLSAQEPLVSANKVVYPNVSNKIKPWSSSVTVGTYSDALGTGLDARFAKIGSGLFIDFEEAKNMKMYSKLMVSYWPGTCQGTGIYFDSFKKGMVMLKNGVANGSWLSAVVNLNDVVDTRVTPNNMLSATRLVLEGVKADERCIIHDIKLE